MTYSLCTPSRLHLGHDRQRLTVAVLEEGHPLFHPIRMLEDHVRGVCELDAASLQVLIGGVDVGHAEVEDALLARLAIARRLQKEAGAAAVEEGELADAAGEAVEVRQSEDIAVPPLRLVDIGDVPRDLADGPKVKLRCCHRSLLFAQGASPGRAPPLRSAARPSSPSFWTAFST